MSQLNRLQRVVLSLFALILLSAATARADTITIVGRDTGLASTATVTCTFNSQTNTFTFTVTNTSPSGSTITGIGFDLVAGDFNANDDASTGLNGFTGNQTGAVPPGSSVFSFSDGALGNVPHGFGNSAVLDFGFITGDNFSGGNPPLGISPGESASFTVTGAAFAGMTESEICNAIFVRFQSVPVGEGSDVGVPGDTPEIPEPATLLLFGTGLAGFATALRKRRQTKG